MARLPSRSCGFPKNGGGKLQFAVDTKTHRVVLIGIPLIAFCE